MKTGCCNDEMSAPELLRAPRHIALIGHPNAGKTTLFNRLTGARQRTGNWPGVTVERKTGQFTLCGHRFEVVDLPGVYLLEGDSTPDERITREFLRAHPDYLYINVVDASTLERGLYLTAEIRELGVPTLLVLNKMDVARKRGMQIDTQLLSHRLDCPVITLSLSRDKCLDPLLEAIIHFDPARQQQPLHVPYPIPVETALLALQEASHIPRYVALRRLRESSEGESARRRQAIERETGEELDFLLADARFRFTGKLADEAIFRRGEAGITLSDHIDRWVLGSWTGIPLFLMLIYLLFLFSINLGGAFVDFFDRSVQAILVDGGTHLLRSFALPEWSITLLAQGIGGGIQVVATFIPIIAALYLFLTLLEESGYMARAAFVMDRFLRRLGLSGKAFVPLIIGFGCNVPAIMATRTLGSYRERILTILMAPFMSCGARLTVYALFATVFFPQGGQNVIFLLYLTGIGFAILTGLVIRKTLLPGETSDFIMEIPPYRLPSLRNVIQNTWNKLNGFILGAGKIIVIVVTILTVVNSVGTDGSFGNENSEKSLLSTAAKSITPLFEPMGIREDNWPATVGIITGLLAKEVVVGTLNALYTNLDGGDIATAAPEPESFSLEERLREAFATIPANLGTALGQLTDPLGLKEAIAPTELHRAAERHNVDTATFIAMRDHFDGQAGAFAYLLFILLYLPCVATISAMWKEAGPRWTLLGIVWSTGLAYSVAVVFYQLATLTLHPLQSMLWSGGVIVFAATVILLLQRMGSRKPALRHRNAG